jgi:hypothetical protein
MPARGAKVLSPAKFAEYTSCPGIGDYRLVCGVHIRTEALR